MDIRADAQDIFGSRLELHTANPKESIINRQGAARIPKGRPGRGIDMAGHEMMIGLPPKEGERPLLRAYSIASANYEEQLEFLSIKVPDGPLTSKLQHIKPGDKVIVGRKPTGTLVTDYLLPGKRLWLLATGTGLAPFLSITRDPDTLAVDCNLFDQVTDVLPTQVVRIAAGGVRGPHDVMSFARCGADVVLVGEAIIRSTDPQQFVAELVAAGAHPALIPSAHREVL